MLSHLMGPLLCYDDEGPVVIQRVERGIFGLVNAIGWLFQAAQGDSYA